MTNPPNSSHPTSLEAQAEKSEERLAVDLMRYKGVCSGVDLIDPIGAAFRDAWSKQDAHCQPIVEALKAEVEELKRERIVIATDLGTSFAELTALRKQIEQLTSRLTLAESISAKAEITANKLVKAQEQIEQLTAELERAKDALRTCKYYVYDGQPHYQFDVQKVEAVFNPIDR